MKLGRKLGRSLWTLQTTNPHVIKTQYAVRGVVPMRANVIAGQLGQGSHPFTDVTYCNIGNPQEFGQKPFTFFREVMAAVLDPSLIKREVYSPDVCARAQKFLNEITSAGAYTASLGIPSIRTHVAEFIAKTYGVPKPSINNIFLTEGASQGVHMVLNSLITDQRDSIMVPVPQYPLYSGAIQLLNGHLQEYYLEEDKGWAVSRQHLEAQFEKDRKKGKSIRAVILINPGNPTGAVLSRQTLEQILKFAHAHGLVVIADEVYRQNVYSGAKFWSAREVLHSLGGQIAEQLELVTLNSISKGVVGECGLRGGYMQLHNIKPEVRDMLQKLKSLFLCSNSMGQIGVDLMVHPPVEGVSQATLKQFKAEKDALFQSLKHRSSLVYESLKKMDNITIAPVEGAMYAFPRIHFSEKAKARAHSRGQNPDLMYCLDLLEQTGIVTVPGSGFKQAPGTHHFRITTLILPEKRLQEKMERLAQFNKEFHMM